MRKRLSDERGISAVIVAISLIGIFGATMLSLDAGNMWQTRRNIIIGTDSTALDQAKYLARATNQTACRQVAPGVLSWEDFMLRNSGGGTGATPISCVPHPDGTGDTGYVVVEGRKEARTRFGGLFGIGNTSPYSLSAAVWAFPADGRGLRPIAFCNQNSHVKDWLRYIDGTEPWTPAMSFDQYKALGGTGDTNGDTLEDYPYYAPLSNSYATNPANNSAVVHRMYMNNDLDDGKCGDFPGNWGWLNFDGDSAPTTDRNEWTENGYNEGSVTIRDEGEPSCPAEPGGGTEEDTEEGCVPSDTGAISPATEDALNAIIGKAVQIMIFDTGVCVEGSKSTPKPSGGGVTCNFESWAVLGVILRDFDAKGPEDTRYLDFEFTEIILSGTWVGTPPNGVDTGARVTAICEVDHDVQATETIESRCT